MGKVSSSRSGAFYSSVDSFQPSNYSSTLFQRLCLSVWILTHFLFLSIDLSFLIAFLCLPALTLLPFSHIHWSHLEITSYSHRCSFSERKNRERLQSKTSRQKRRITVPYGVRRQEEGLRSIEKPLSNGSYNQLIAHWAHRMKKNTLSGIV